MAANIVLTGFMGTGKSTVARLLAAELDREFIDTDALIAARHGDLADIFLHRGEGAFRDIERDLAAELASRDGLVVASGGGMLLDPEVADVISEGARVFCLTAESDTILARVISDKSGTMRPLLVGPDPAGRVVDLLAQRAIRYGSFEQVPTDERPPAEVVADIISRLDAGAADIRGHYAQSALIERVAAALEAAGHDLDGLSPAELAGFDEFHLGGHAATTALVDCLELGADATVLDVGCGVGGAARAIAHSAACSVVGIDLTPDFIDTARWLTERLRMQDRIDFRVANALDLPFGEGTFDAITMLHVGMNIDDKGSLMTELARVLARGGQLGIYDLMRVDDGDIDYPMPWAASASTSSLSTAAGYQEALKEAGLTVQSSIDCRQLVVEAIQALGGSAPAVNLGHLMGAGWPRMQENMISAFRRGIVSPIRIVATKPSETA